MGDLMPWYDGDHAATIAADTAASVAAITRHAQADLRKRDGTP